MLLVCFLVNVKCGLRLVDLTAIHIIYLRRSYYYPRVSGLERQTKCQDPAYQRDPSNTNMYDGAINALDANNEPIFDIDKDEIMPVNTYYPRGTVCYNDESGGKKSCHQLYIKTPISGSCPEFGVSGSGIVREWKKRPETGPAIDFSTSDPQYQHSFVGPLSMSKGCDLTFDYSQYKGRDRYTDVPEFIYRGKVYYVRITNFDKHKILIQQGLNPMVATDAICFMPWIAAEYGLRLAEDYQVRPSCFTGVGDKKDINKEVCW